MTFRPMRRNRQQLDENTCLKILENNTAGVLAVSGDEGYPYAVPLSYVYADGALYFHCAKAGHKTDAIRKYDKVSFCVVDQDEIVPERYTTYFRSVIVFGRARVMENPGEVFSTRIIYERVWQANPYGSENAVAVHIRHLREKIEINPSEPRYIKVVWGRGYKMEGGK